MNKFTFTNIKATVYKGKINAVSCVLINILLTIVLISANSIYMSFNNYLSDLIKYKSETRSILVLYDSKDADTETAKKELSDCNSHIEKIITQDELQAGGVIEELVTEKIDGSIITKGCDMQSLPTLIDSTEYNESDNWCIVPEKLYPDSGITSYLDKNNYVDGKSLVGQEITLLSDVNHFDGTYVYTIDKMTFPLKVIGTYDASKTFDSANVCYTSFELNEKINSTVNDETIGKKPNLPLILLVDEEKNVNEVMQSINHSKYRVQLRDSINKDAPKLIKIIADSICIALYCFSIILFFILLMSMIKKSKNEIALMKSVGYTDKKIKNIFCTGFFILDIIGYFSGIIGYIAVKLCVQNRIIDTNYYFSNMKITSTVSDFVFPFISLMVIPLIIIIPVYSKIKRISPVELWADEK